MTALSLIERTIIGCRRCPELRSYAAGVAREKKREHRDCDYWAKPVPGFGDARARLILVGLAPGAHGSNRTGRPFTGDASGRFLYPALHRAGFASQPESLARDDGLALRDCFITAALRCAPPQNRPTPAELQNCFRYLLEEFDALTSAKAIVPLGSIAFTAVLRLLRARGFSWNEARFAHGAEFCARDGSRNIAIIASYHPSRQNTNTGKLTAAMFDAIFTRVRQVLQDADGDRAPVVRERGLARPSSRRARLDSSETR
jgi:uracil-DNA glycosylase family 4